MPSSVKSAARQSSAGKDRITELRGPIAVSTGEPSGRLYAGLVETALKRQQPDIRIVRLEAGRVQPAVFGFAESLWSAPALRRALKEDRRRLAELAPHLVLLVGFSNYNIALGRYCRGLGLPVVFLAPPQLWAWGGWRSRLLRQAADRCITLFPFEAEWLQARNIRADFLGNPLVDLVQVTSGRPETLARLGLEPDERYIAFLPGSRPAEREWHRPRFERVRLPGYRHIFMSADETLAGTESADPDMLPAAAARRYDLIAHADAAVVVSGTATLETALLGTPQVVCYHLAPISRLAARLLVRSRHFALPNILLGRKAVPELLEPAPARIRHELEILLTDPESRNRAEQAAARLRRLLGPPAAAERIARRLPGL